MITFTLTWWQVILVLWAATILPLLVSYLLNIMVESRREKRGAVAPMWKTN